MKKINFPLRVFVCRRQPTRGKGPLAPEKGLTACLTSFHFVRKLGHPFIKKKNFLEHPTLLVLGNMAINKDKKRTLELLGRGMADVCLRTCAVCQKQEQVKKLANTLEVDTLWKE